MNEAKRSIFRVDALRRYAQSREEPVLLRLVSPRMFLCLWILLGLLLIGGFLAWLAQVPVYASGSAVVVDGRGKTPSIGDEVLVVAFVPPEHLRRLRVGQMLLLEIGGVGKRSGRSIIAVEPEIIGPDMAQRRFALNAGATPAITQPSAIAIARLDPLITGLPAAAYVGSIYRAEIEVGSRRAISLLPLIGHFFGA
jgi:hypothetical protein